MSNPSRTKNFLGKGWPFPIMPSPVDSQLHYVEGAEKVRQSIWIILQTEPGERLMNPSFGCGLRQYLMKPNNSATRAMIKRDIDRALGLWEPRIKVEEINVEAGEDPALVMIYIHYTHVRDGSAANLVFPFYLE